MLDAPRIYRPNARGERHNRYHRKTDGPLREAAQCQAVLDAEKKKYNNPIIVTFNYRYAPKHQKIKEIIQAGEIGEVTSVDFSWFLEYASLTARIIFAAGIV